jgi:N-acetylneuraminate synthase
MLTLYAVADIAAGEFFTRNNVRAIRPGYGLPPRELERVLTHSARQSIRRGEPLRFELLA